MNSQKITITLDSVGLNRYLSKIVGFGNKQFNYRGDIYIEVINIINIKENAEYLLILQDMLI